MRTRRHESKWPPFFGVSRDSRTTLSQRTIFCAREVRMSTPEEGGGLGGCVSDDTFPLGAIFSGSLRLAMGQRGKRTKGRNVRARERRR